MSVQEALWKAIGRKFFSANERLVIAAVLKFPLTSVPTSGADV